MLPLLLELATCSTDLIDLAGNWIITTSRVDPSGETYEPSDNFLLNLNSPDKFTATGGLVNIGRSLDSIATVTFTDLRNDTPFFNITTDPTPFSATLDFTGGSNAVGNVNGSSFSVRIVGGTEIEVTVVKGNDRLTVYRAQNLSDKAPRVVLRILHVWFAVIAFTGAVMIFFARKSEGQKRRRTKRSNALNSLIRL
jgi:hypothetical protein